MPPLVKGLSEDTINALKEMLEVDWAAASKDEVPDLGETAARLAAPRKPSRRKARATLTELADHPVCGLLVPFLLRLLADPALPDRAALLHLLAAISPGRPPLGERLRVDLVLDTAGRTRREIYRAVAAAVPEAIQMLSGAEDERVAAAAFLAWFPTPEARSRLRDRLTEETSPLPLAVGILALGRGGNAPEPEDLSSVETFYQHPDERVALAARISAALLTEAATEETLAALEAELPRASAPFEGFPWPPLHDLAVHRYLALRERFPERALEHLPEALASGGEIVASALLTLAFPEPLTEGADPSPPQVRALAAVLSSPGLEPQELKRLLSDAGLGGDPDRVRDRIGLPVDAPDDPLLSRPVFIGEARVPFHLAWRRMIWGRSPLEPEPLVADLIRDLDPKQTLDAFRAAARLPLEPAQARLPLPELPGGTPVPGTRKVLYKGKVRAAERAAAYRELLLAEGWRDIDQWDNPPRDHSGHFLRGAVLLEVDFTYTWSDALHGFVDDEMSLGCGAELCLGRLFGPLGQEAHGAGFTAGLVEWADRLAKALPQEDIPFAWALLETAAALSEQTGEPPDDAFDRLFRRLHVTWIPMARRTMYLDVCPEPRAETLALWMLEKEPGNDWLISVVPTPAVRERIRARRR